MALNIVKLPVLLLLVTTIITMLNACGAENIHVQNSSSPFSSCGMLPNSSAPSNITSIQKQVELDLKSGLPETAFTSDAPDPKRAIMEVGARNSSKEAWPVIGGKRQFYLVARHLKRESLDKYKAILSGFCSTGDLLTGYAAAKPYIYREHEGAAFQSTTVTPYGILVCSKEKEQSYQITKFTVISDHKTLKSCK